MARILALHGRRRKDAAGGGTGGGGALSWPTGWGARPALGSHHGIGQPFSIAYDNQGQIIWNPKVDYETWLGRPCNIIKVWPGANNTWDDIAGGAGDDINIWSGQLFDTNPNAAFDPAKWPVTLPIVFALWAVPQSHANRQSNDGTWSRPSIWTEIVDGTYDIYYIRLFKRLAQKCNLTGRNPRTLVIRLAWECNGNWYPHSVGPDKTAFIAAWRRIIELMRTSFADVLGSGQRCMVEFGPSGHLKFGNGATERLWNIYPGDDWVDICGLGIHDHVGITTQSDWDQYLHYPITIAGSPFEGILDWFDFSISRGKWIGTSEIKSNYVPTTYFPKTQNMDVMWRTGFEVVRQRYDGKFLYFIYFWNSNSALKQADNWGEPYRLLYQAGPSQELPSPLRTVNVANASQLSSALANAQPGDHIVLADGTYSGTFTLSVPGTSAAPIVVKAANKLGATISGNFQIQANYQIVWGLVFGPGSGIPTWTGNSCKLLRCKFDGGFAVDDASTITVRGTDCEISRCEFLNQRSRAITVNVAGGARRAVIRRNWFHDVVDSGSNYNVAVRIGQSSVEENTSAYCTVEYNLFERYDARYGETVALKSCSNTVRFNTLLDCRISAIQNRVGHMNEISGNWIEDQTGAAGGVRVMDRDNVLLGNVLVGSGMRFEIFAGNRQPDERENDYSPPAYYPAAWNTILAGNRGAVTVGVYYGSITPPMTVTAKNTLIEAHTGTITYSRHEQTTVSPTTSRNISTAFKLTPAEVGPNAP